MTASHPPGPLWWRIWSWKRGLMIWLWCHLPVNQKLALGGLQARTKLYLNPSVKRDCVHDAEGVCDVHGARAKEYWRPAKGMVRGRRGSTPTMRHAKEWYWVCDLGTRGRGKMRQQSSFGHFGPLRTSQGMTRPVGSQLGHLKAILVLWGPLQVSMNINSSISETHFVLQISQPLNIAQKLFCIQNFHTDLSFQKKKTV